MDFFGIGAAIKGAMKIYFQSARATGRTTWLIDNLRDGDRVIFHNSTEATRVEHLCRERGVKIKWSVMSFDDINKILHLKGSNKRLIFDHTWIERYYLRVIEKAQDDIRFFETPSHEDKEEYRTFKTKEINKWMY